MGAFFSNIQLKTSSDSDQDVIEKVIEYIVNINAEAGYVKNDKEDEADKSVIISQSNNLKWISIYDEDTEDQNIKKINKLASRLSKQFKTNVLSVLVNDSDTIYLGLSNNGVLKDKLSNRSNKVDFNKSKPNVWSEILISNYTFEDIKGVWEKNYTFIEDFLKPFGELINLESSHLLTGFDYINEKKQKNKVKLNFALKDKKTTPIGPTKFSMVTGINVFDVKKGDLHTIEHLIVTNQGDSSKGIEIIIAGECITEDLLIPQSVTANLFRSKEEYTTKFKEALSTTNKKLFYAEIEDFHIPKGYETKFPMSPKESKRYGEKQFECGISFKITLLGGESGTGEFTVYFFPLVNRENGSDSTTTMKGTMEDWLKKNE